MCVLMCECVCAEFVKGRMGCGDIMPSHVMSCDVMWCPSRVAYWPLFGSYNTDLSLTRSLNRSHCLVHTYLSICLSLAHLFSLHTYTPSEQLFPCLRDDDRWLHGYTPKAALWP
mmetsp:Transcript_39948/g.113835  ORF Transcript_39948/g.113835 Transcript_39948/m.113835 type:complete len:114 (+) Transcript_39948:878-1219(+)